MAALYNGERLWNSDVMLLAPMTNLQLMSMLCVTSTPNVGDWEACYFSYLSPTQSNCFGAVSLFSHAWIPARDVLTLLTLLKIHGVGQWAFHSEQSETSWDWIIEALSMKASCDVFVVVVVLSMIRCASHVWEPRILIVEALSVEVFLFLPVAVFMVHNRFKMIVFVVSNLSLYCFFN